MKGFSLRLLSLLLLLTACAYAASAQGIVTGTITGTISISSGAVVRDAPIVATNAATGAKIAGKTDNSGGVALSDVPIGTLYGGCHRAQLRSSQRLIIFR